MNSDRGRGFLFFMPGWIGYRASVLPGIALILMFVFFSGGAQSAQVFRVKDGDTITVKISSRELTRLAVFGDGRIDKVWKTVGVLDVQSDIASGEIFVQPLPGAPALISFFIRDNSGATYTVVAQQYDVPSESIILKPAGVLKSIGRGSEYRATPYVDRIKRLIKGMALGGDVDGYSFEDTKEIVPLWKEANIELIRVYTGYDLSGETYIIKNVSGKEMVLGEREFFDFGNGVRAVALERSTLADDESTFVYVVRKSEGER